MSEVLFKIMLKSTCFSQGILLLDSLFDQTAESLNIFTMSGRSQNNSAQKSVLLSNLSGSIKCEQYSLV